MKRAAPSSLPQPKRTALAPLNQLATPPTTPEKTRVVDLPAGKGKKLNLHASVYAQAKALFQRGARNTGTCLVGREDEAAQFERFLQTSLREQTCNSLYISGPPGTGKTAQVNLTLDTMPLPPLVKVMRVNCMTVLKPDHIFHEIHAFCTGTSGKRKTYDDVHALLADRSSPTTALVVVLDEMDYLVTRDQQVLFHLFHCASRLNSTLHTKLIVVGISNALDLTDKFLPRLRSNGLHPQALQFLPYLAEQIKRVVTAKLHSLTGQDKENIAATPLMHPGAIQMCCRKCAAVTGDLRKAFDICYKSIEHVEQQARKQPDFGALTLATAPKVLISHVARVCAQTFGELSLQKIKSLNTLQKAVLCTLFHHERTCNLAKVLTVNELYDYYCKHTVLAVDNLLGLIRKGEYLEIVSALELASAVILAQGKGDGNKQVRPNVLYVDVEKAVEEVGVLRRILLHN